MTLLSNAFGAVGQRLDPPLNHNFLVSLLDSSSGLVAALGSAVSAITDAAVAGFSECSGLEMSLKVEDYNEGGRNGTVLKFPTRISWGPITLKRGVALSSTLWDWQFGFVQGLGHRRDGIITLLNEQQLPLTVWYFRRALPVKYTGPALNATQNNVAIESIELVHEGIYQLPLSLGAAVGAIVGAIGGAASGTLGSI
jgi:phage tail-like protein